MNTVTYQKTSSVVPSPFNRKVDLKSQAFQELKDNIREHGIIQPLLARQRNGSVELIAGERRWQAAKALKLPTVPVIIREKVTDLEAIELQTIENEEREDLTPLQKAEKYQQLIDQLTEKDRPDIKGLTMEKAVEHIAQKLSKGKSTIYEALRLLKLPATVKVKVESGELPPSTAALLAKLDDAPDVQDRIATQILTEEKGDWRDRDDKGRLSFRDSKELIEDELKLTKARKAYREQAATAKAAGIQLVPETAYETNVMGRRIVKGFWPGDQQISKFGYRKLSELMGKKAPPYFLGCTENYSPVKYYKITEAQQAIKANGAKVKKQHSHADTYAKQQQTRAELKLKMEPVVEAAKKELQDRLKKTKKFPWAMIVEVILHNTDWDELETVSKEHGFRAKGKDSRRFFDAIVTGGGRIPLNKLPKLLLSLLLHSETWNEYSGNWGNDITALAKFYGLDLKKLTKQILKEEGK